MGHCKTAHSKRRARSMCRYLAMRNPFLPPLQPLLMLLSLLPRPSAAAGRALQQQVQMLGAVMDNDSDDDDRSTNTTVLVVAIAAAVVSVIALAVCGWCTYKLCTKTAAPGGPTFPAPPPQAVQLAAAPGAQPAAQLHAPPGGRFISPEPYASANKYMQGDGLAAPMPPPVVCVPPPPSPPPLAGFSSQRTGSSAGSDGMFGVAPNYAAFAQHPANQIGVTVAGAGAEPEVRLQTKSSATDDAEARSGLTAEASLQRLLHAQLDFVSADRRGRLSRLVRCASPAAAPLL